MKRERIPEIHFYEWRVSAWRTSDARRLLDGVGRGIYRELLDACYTQGSILNPELDPSYAEAHARDCAVTVDQFKASWPIMRRYFLVSKNDASLLTNKQADLVRREYFRYIESQRNKGRRGGVKNRGRANPKESIDSEALALEMQSSGLDFPKPNGNTTAIQYNGNTSITTTEPFSNPPLAELESPPKKLTKREIWFKEKFWPIVWAKIGKEAALRAWMKKVTSESEMQRIVDAAIAQGPTILERGRRPGNSVLHPETWIRNGRYDDEFFDEPSPPKPIHDGRSASQMRRDAALRSIEEADLSDVQSAYEH